MKIVWGGEKTDRSSGDVRGSEEARLLAGTLLVVRMEQRASQHL